jgi:membrane protein DedA with SNARE-associated domain
LANFQSPLKFTASRTAGTVIWGVVTSGAGLSTQPQVTTPSQKAALTNVVILAGFLLLIIFLIFLKIQHNRIVLPVFAILP